MGEVIKLALTLTVISALAGLAIGGVFGRTQERIAAQQLAARQTAVAAVFLDGTEVKEMSGKGTDVLPDQYWVGFDGEDVVGYAFELSGRGYAGDIRFMAGVDVSGKIVGITVLDHNETPGLGSRVNEIPSTRYIWNPFAGEDAAKPWFTEQFEGLSVQAPITIDKIAEWHNLDLASRENLRGRNAVTSITGSTITTAAFTRAIERHVSTYLDALGGFCCPAAKRAHERGEVFGEPIPEGRL